jgi:hypothetical protein
MQLTEAQKSEIFDAVEEHYLKSLNYPALVDAVSRIVGKPLHKGLIEAVVRLCPYFDFGKTQRVRNRVGALADAFWNNPPFVEPPKKIKRAMGEQETFVNPVEQDAASAELRSKYKTKQEADARVKAIVTRIKEIRSLGMPQDLTEEHKQLWAELNALTTMNVVGAPK